MIGGFDRRMGEMTLNVAMGVGMTLHTGEAKSSGTTH